MVARVGGRSPQLEAMDIPYLIDWLNLLVRWAHFIFGAAWIGTSFYFNWLNNSMRLPSQPREGELGEVWSVHGGAYYRVTKHDPDMKALPKPLHWFKWEAYLTWISGVSLLAIVYYFRADSYLIDPQVAAIDPKIGIAIGVGSLIAAWLVYDLLCRSPLGKKPVPLAAIGFVLLTVAAYALSQVLSARAAYIHIGAMIGTCMALNVFFHIIPGQRAMVDATAAGKKPDANRGVAGAMRSLHNNYLTLPVLFIMISNHFPATFGHQYNWAILVAISVIGAGTRHWFNMHGKGRRNVWILPAAAISTIGLAIAARPAPPPEFTATTPSPGQPVEEAFEPVTGPVSFAEARRVIDQRCLPCHAAKPSHPSYLEPPKGRTFDTPAQIKAAIDVIKQQTVDTHTMPLGNLTRITPREREVLRVWLSEGASITTEESIEHETTTPDSANPDEVNDDSPGLNGAQTPPTPPRHQK